MTSDFIVESLSIELSSILQDPKSKTKAALYLRTTPLSRASRRMCEHMVSLRRSSRNPVKPIDMKAIKGHVRSKLPVITAETIRNLNSFQGWRRHWSILSAFTCSFRLIRLFLSQNLLT